MICHTFAHQCVPFIIFFNSKVIQYFNNQWGGFLKVVSIDISYTIFRMVILLRAYFMKSV